MLAFEAGFVKASEVEKPTLLGRIGALFKRKRPAAPSMYDPQLVVDIDTPEGKMPWSFDPETGRFVPATGIASLDLEKEVATYVGI